MVGGDLGERRLEQRFPLFADTEGAGGSTPPAPTRPALSSTFAGRLGGVPGTAEEGDTFGSSLA
jgi:hypothetical protein